MGDWNWHIYITVHNITNNSLLYSTGNYSMFCGDLRASQEVLLVKSPSTNAGDTRHGGSTPGLGRSPGEGISYQPTWVFLGFPGVSDDKKSACNAGDLGWIPCLGRSHGEGNPLHYSGPENPMDRGAWQARVYGVAKSWTRLSNFHNTTIKIKI